MLEIVLTMSALGASLMGWAGSVGVEGQSLRVMVARPGVVALGSFVTSWDGKSVSLRGGEKTAWQMSQPIVCDGLMHTLVLVEDLSGHAGVGVGSDFGGLGVDAGLKKAALSIEASCTATEGVAL